MVKPTERLDDKTGGLFLNMKPGRKERKLLAMGLEELGIYPCKDVLNIILQFLDELLIWNDKTNLIGTKSPEEIIIRHILDSLSIYHLLKDTQGTIIDIGAGAGFPSVPLAIVFPYVDISVVEKRKRRASFLYNVKYILGLENFKVYQCNAKEIKQKFDYVITRGVGDLDKLYNLSKKILKEKGMIIAFKGKLEEIEKEVSKLRESGSDGKDLKLSIHRVKVPYLKEEERNIVIIETG